MHRATHRLLLPAALVVLMVGCTPEYPRCDGDQHCKEGEYCVNKLCQQCRDDRDCGAGQRCNKGRCERIPGYCTSSSDCADGKVCKESRCVPCSADTECGEGGRCNSGRCLEARRCVRDEDCPENHECQGGVCVAPPGYGSAAKAPPASCQPEPVYFDFDEFILSTEATKQLQQAAACIKAVRDRNLRLEGHCDERGTEEYNLALGDRRVRSVFIK